MGCSMNDIEIIINWLGGGTIMAWCNHCEWHQDEWADTNGVALKDFFNAADRHVYGAARVKD